jgi:dienelactone hydrolase
MPFDQVPKVITSPPRHIRAEVAAARRCRRLRLRVNLNASSRQQGKNSVLWSFAGAKARRLTIALFGPGIGTLLPARLSLSAPGQTLYWAAAPGENYARAAFSLWYPNGTPPVRGVIVLVPGSNQDGRDQINDRAWRALAVRQNLALVGCYLADKPHPNMGLEAYAEASRGSGQALLDAIDAFGKQLNHPELAKARLLLWGMSAGGEFNYEFVAWRPDRVAGFIVNKGGIYYSDLLAAEARRVPGLFFVGGKDSQFRQDAIRRLLRINSVYGSNWTLIEEPAVAHAIGRSRELAETFFETVLAPEPVSASQSKPNR